MLNTYMRRIDLLSKLCAPVRPLFHSRNGTLLISWLAFRIPAHDLLGLLKSDDGTFCTGFDDFGDGVSLD